MLIQKIQKKFSNDQSEKKRLTTITWTFEAYKFSAHEIIDRSDDRYENW